MYRIKDVFTQIDESICSEVKFGNNSETPLKGKERILIKLNDGTQSYIPYLFYVLELYQNC